MGGGYTGLSTALALQEAGVEAVVLERDFCGYGASGRNAGHLTPTICKDLPTANLLFGPRRRLAARTLRRPLRRDAEALLQQHGIDCDYHPAATS